MPIVLLTRTIPAHLHTYAGFTTYYGYCISPEAPVRHGFVCFDRTEILEPYASRGQACPIVTYECSTLKF